MKNENQKIILGLPVPEYITDPEEKIKWALEILKDQESVKSLMKELTSK